MTTVPEGNEGEVALTAQEPVEQRELQEAIDIADEPANTPQAVVPEEAGEVVDVVADAIQEPNEDDAAQSAEEQAIERRASEEPTESAVDNN
jgi:hypothetical protein